jgi:AraC family transcriptional regulator of adaptative response / DNA-3-methyladenine glycosylase II
MELPDREVCYRALQSRDPRFDGLLFVSVTSTGIYCRPVCPARTPKFENCRFFGSAAAAQEAGFRPCLRCRPETAPDLASWRGTSNTVSRALALITDGALDGDGASVETLAERLGVGERQLRRLFLQHLGASPISVAQTRRVLFAKQLIHETRMPMTQVALAAGFGSLRRFNETFRNLFHRPPSALRHKTSVSPASAEAGVTLRLRYRPPYDWDSMLGYLQARAIPGVEIVENGSYRRTVEIDGFTGSVEVTHLPQRQSLGVTIRFPNVRSLPAIVSRVRRLFDPWWRDVLGCARPVDGMALSWRCGLFSASRSASPLHAGSRDSSLHSMASLYRTAMVVTRACRTCFLQRNVLP